jgi:capsular polysaccharide biosynthesis protein
MTIGAYLLILRRHWVAVAVMTLLGAAAAVGVTAVTPKVYSATTTQFVRGVPGASATAEYQAAQFATSRAKSYSALIGNPDVLSGVIDQLGLKMNPAELYGRLTVDNPTDTVLINVTARGTTAAEAQSISVSAADNLAKLIIRLESAGATGGKSPIDVQTAVPAPLPTSPTAPRPVLNLAVGTMLGLALGSILALILDSRRRIRLRGRARGRRARPLRARGASVAPKDGPVVDGQRTEPDALAQHPDLSSVVETPDDAAEISRAEALPVGPSTR